MAIAYLNAGATSLAGANWSDTTGFANEATLVIRDRVGTGDPVITGLDQSGLTEGIQYLDITSGASGQIGDQNNSLVLDADSSSGATDSDATAFVRNRGTAFRLYVTAGGNDGVIWNYDFGPGTYNHLTGGNVKNVTGDGGELHVAASTVINNMVLNGGTGDIPYNETKPTAVTINAGRWTLRRVPTLLIINGGTVDFYPDAGASMTSTAIVMNAGLLNWYRGAFPTTTINGGTTDLTKAVEPFTPGATAGVWNGGKILGRDGLVDTSNLVRPYAFQPSNQSNYGGAPIPL